MTEAKKRILIRAARAVRGVAERTYRCADCGAALERPLERNAVYVLRDGWPRLVCQNCVLETDLYIWGTREVLHPDDRPKEETAPEEAEAVPEESGAAGPEAVEVSSVEEQLECI
ncbi:MAG: hypothetical protein JRD89_21205 [Deltaproteobacteria bacterium]|nr:hypothetical protein [Deltaproteobacteria bacterium]